MSVVAPEYSADLTVLSLNAKDGLRPQGEDLSFEENRRLANMAEYLGSLTAPDLIHFSEGTSFRHTPSDEVWRALRKNGYTMLIAVPYESSDAREDDHVHYLYAHERMLDRTRAEYVWIAGRFAVHCSVDINGEQVDVDFVHLLDRLIDPGLKGTRWHAREKEKLAREARQAQALALVE